MSNINDTPTFEKDGQGNLTQKGWLDRERDRTQANNSQHRAEMRLAKLETQRDRAVITTLKTEVKSLDSTLSRSEIDLIIELRKLLVKIDNHAHESGTKPTGYSYQDFLINLAREANGHFGI